MTNGDCDLNFQQNFPEAKSPIGTSSPSGNGVQAVASAPLCKQKPTKPSAKYKAGDSIPLKFFGTASHGGGNCEFALSYNDGRNFITIGKPILGNCMQPAPKSVQIPAGAPSGTNVIFAWFWNNKEGNRELYMNCAMISITGSAGGSIKGFLPALFNYPFTKGGKTMAYTLPPLNGNTFGNMYSGRKPITMDGQGKISGGSGDLFPTEYTFYSGQLPTASGANVMMVTADGLQSGSQGRGTTAKNGQDPTGKCSGDAMVCGVRDIFQCLNGAWISTPCAPETKCVAVIGTFYCDRDTTGSKTTKGDTSSKTSAGGDTDPTETSSSKKRKPTADDTDSTKTKNPPKKKNDDE
ncbi:hypothetical protein IWQ60_003684 [Tieghemiomyces parasiticus]|uniref:Chitin-binding type-4 domain-containing protein n=1 Tax=Tieghemiomyces parasiticus TaxID=78921 RepID=A0A9W8A965_9FUNG|nr:hypothetical protein IWQ60_003684 [Tieghemiomyces parasiticus]